MNVIKIAGYEQYAKRKLCARDVEKTVEGMVTDFETCARNCDEKGQMFAVDSSCYEGHNIGSQCKCVCFKVNRNDNNAGTCNMVDAADWKLYRFVDGTF